MPAEVEVGGVALLEQPDPQLGQADPVELDARRGDAVERLAPPEPERLAQVAGDRVGRRGLPGLTGEVLALVEVDGGAVGFDEVAGMAGDEGVAELAP